MKLLYLLILLQKKNFCIWTVWAIKVFSKFEIEVTGNAKCVYMHNKINLFIKQR